MAAAVRLATSAGSLNRAGSWAPRERATLAALLAMLAASISFFAPLESWQRLLYDQSLRLGTRQAPGDLVIVAVDERSLSELGRWPFSRTLHAKLLDRLTDAGASAVGFTVLFAEPDEDPDADARLAQAMSRNGRVVLPVVGESARSDVTLRESQPLRQLVAASAALGHVDVELDADGIARSTFRYAGLGTARWPSLAIAMARVAGELPPPGIRTASGPEVAAWVREEQILIPFLGPPGHFTRLSYVDVLEDRIPASFLAGKLVLIGVTATGLSAGLSTPVSGGSIPMASVEIMANVLQAVRDRRGISRAPGLAAAAVSALIAFLGGFVSLGLTRSRDALGLCVAAGLASVMASHLLLHLGGIWWSPVAPVVALAAAFGTHGVGSLHFTRKALLREKRRVEDTLHGVGDAVLTVDADMRVVYLNAAAARLTVVQERTAQGRLLAQVLALIDGTTFLQAIEDCLQGGGGQILPAPVGLRDRDGLRREMHASVCPIAHDHGRAVVLALHDLTETLRLEREIEFQASHDALTGLPNRNLVSDRLDRALVRARRDRRILAVLFLDLDHFKWINDSFGHSFGDALLVDIAQRLQDACRANDTVARLGGDEFLVILEDIEDAGAVAAIAGKFMRSVATPCRLEGQTVEVSASIGVSLFPRDSEDAESLLKHADTAMYRAKENGRNNVCFFAEDMNLRARRRAEVEQRLRQALDRNEFELHYQPIVDLDTGRVLGTEALLRWPSAPEGTGPSDFVTVAEECGAIVTIGRWVLEQACGQLRRWDEQGLGGLRMAVNLSPRQILGPELSGCLAGLLTEPGIEPHRLELEITETVMMHDATRYADALHALKAQGVRLSIDDFGTGYSSLGYLKRFPVDRLKIDRSFVQDLGRGGEGEAISRAILAMARSMHLTVVAEGIETPAQLAFLRDIGCREGQGFLLSPPLPAATLYARLARGQGLLRRSGTPAFAQDHEGPEA